METEELRRTAAAAGLSRGSADAGFLSRSEVAGLFGVSLSTVTRWARTGLLPAVRTPGGHYRYCAEDVRRLTRRIAAVTDTD